MQQVDLVAGSNFLVPVNVLVTPVPRQFLAMLTQAHVEAGD